MDGENGARPDVTLTEFLIGEWLPAIRSTVRATTYSNYVTHVRSQLVPRLGEHVLSEIDGRMINRLYSTLLTDGRVDGRSGGLQPSSVRRLHAALHKELKDAVRWGYLDNNPADAADPPKLRAEAPREMRTWTAAELHAFLEFARADTFYPLWFVLATTGMRRGEALGLRWCDIDLGAGHLAVRQNMVMAGAELHLSTPKTNRGRRVVAIDIRTVEVLEAFRARSRHVTPSALVFEPCFDRGISPPLISKRFQNLNHASGLPRIRLHDLRHTHATLALEAGVHPKIVSERLGHSTVLLTLDVYSHAVPHMQRAAADEIARVLFGEPKSDGR